jgi:hypothetical protein
MSLFASKKHLSSHRLRILAGVGTLALLFFAPLCQLQNDARPVQSVKTRIASLWPFASNDPWNLPIGLGAKFAPIQSPVFSNSKGGYLNSREWSHPIFMARSNYPLRTIFHTDGKVCAKVRAADYFLPDRQDDAHLHIIDANRSQVVETWRAKKRRDGNFTAQACYVNSLKGAGMYPYHHGTRAYGGSAIAGLIRTHELTDGIRHAIAVGTNGAGLNKKAPNGKCFVWPASACDNFYGTVYGSSGNLYMGSLLAIPPTVNINRLPLQTKQGKIIAKAMQDYGAYITDNAGGNLIFYAETAAASKIDPRIEGDLSTIAKYVKVLTNNRPETPAGGGKRRAPLAPPFKQ